MSKEFYYEVGNARMKLRPIDKPLVYLAGPYTSGNMVYNYKAQCEIYVKLLKEGIVLPYAPLLNHCVDMVFPCHPDEWMTWDLEILRKCEAVLRSSHVLPEVGYAQYSSQGADVEEEFCKQHNIPVFYDKIDLYNYFNNN